jgi:hypothetical protein
MIVFNVDSLEVEPLVGAQGSEFTFRFSVTRSAGAQSANLYIEFDTAIGWWRAETTNTSGGTIVFAKTIQAAGARRVRITADYPAVKLTGETRKNFTVLTEAAAEAEDTTDSLSICQSCRVDSGPRGRIDVGVFYRNIDRSLEGQAGAKHDLRIESLFDGRDQTFTEVMPADVRGWFASNLYGSNTPFSPGLYRVSVTPSVGRGRALGRDRVVYVDSATWRGFRPAAEPGARASGLVHLYPGSRTRIDFVLQAEETWSARTNTNIATIHPELLDDMKNVINKIESYEGTQATITDGFRSFAEQDALYSQGRAGGPEGSRIVTNARGGESYHNYGLAVDVYDIQGASLVNLSAAARGIFDLFGFEWGGNWEGFKDFPHFQKIFGLSTATLRARHDAQQFSPGTAFVDIAPE